MRSDHNEVTAVILRGRNDRFIRMILYDLHSLTRHANGFCSVCDIAQHLGGMRLRVLGVLSKCPGHLINFRRRHAVDVERGLDGERRHLRTERFCEGESVCDSFLCKFRPISWNQNMSIHALLLPSSASYLLSGGRSAPTITQW